jgi:hypothetical protein
MGNPFEELIYDGTLSVLGDPIYLGMLVLVFFVGFVILQGVNNTAAKGAIIFPAVLLATAFIPFGALLIGIFIGFVLYLALMKIVGK